MRKIYPILIALVLALPLAATANAQVAVGVGIGPAVGIRPRCLRPLVCDWGYYPYYPYGCAPYGYYGPNWFVGGLFIGAGPWYHYGWYGHPGYRMADTAIAAPTLAGYRGGYANGYRGGYAGGVGRGYVGGGVHPGYAAPRGGVSGGFRGGVSSGGARGSFSGGGGGGFHGGGGGGSHGGGGGHR